MKKKIAFISDHASPLASLGGTDSGGQNVYVAETAKKIASLGYEIDIFTRKENPKSALEEDFAPGVKVIHISAGPTCKVPKESLLEYMDEFTENVIRYLESKDVYYQIIHAHFWMSGLVAMQIKKRLKIPFVITFHALGYIRKLHQKEADKFPEVRIDIEKEIVAHADYIIAECPQDRSDLIKHYSAEDPRIEIIPCGFNTEHFRPIAKNIAKEKIGLSSAHQVILQLGRMVPRKGVDNVVKAFAKIAPDDPLMRLVIVGGDPDDNAAVSEISSLSALADELGISDQVIFSGNQQREVLKYYYSAADIFVSTPWYEPFGITPLESMACGTPVIGSNVGGIKYTVKNAETGFLIEPKDPDSLAEKLNFLLRNEKIRHQMSRNGLYRVHKYFTWESVSLSLSNLYNSVLKKQPFSNGHLATAISSSYREAISTFQRSSKELIPQILSIVEIMTKALSQGNKILVCGNGGSAAESQHFVAELIGRFEIPERKALPAISLNADTSVITAWANDFNYDEVFSRQIEALGNEGDVLFCLSTSGQSENIVKAIEKAQSLQMVCVNLLGKDGGKAARATPHNIIIPSYDTARIQELHLNTIHVLCKAIETILFNEKPEEEPSDLGIIQMNNLKYRKSWQSEKLFS